jgi:hypothetical protein
VAEFFSRRFKKDIFILNFFCNIKRWIRKRSKNWCFNFFPVLSGIFYWLWSKWNG